MERLLSDKRNIATGELYEMRRTAMSLIKLLEQDLRSDPETAFNLYTILLKEITSRIYAAKRCIDYFYQEEKKGGEA